MSNLKDSRQEEIARRAAYDAAFADRVDALEAGIDRLQATLAALVRDFNAPLEVKATAGLREMYERSKLEDESPTEFANRMMDRGTNGTAKKATV